MPTEFLYQQSEILIALALACAVIVILLIIDLITHRRVWRA